MYTVESSLHGSCENVELLFRLLPSSNHHPLTDSLVNIRPPFAVFPAPAPNITNHITFAIFSFTFARSKSSTCVTDAWEMVKLSYRQAKSHNIDGISPLGIGKQKSKRENPNQVGVAQNKSFTRCPDCN